MKFKVGDWVAAYNGGDRITGKITSLGLNHGNHHLIEVNHSGVVFWFHSKQCRLLKKKQRREIWVAERKEDGRVFFTGTFGTKKDCDMVWESSLTYIRAVKFVEVKE